MFVKANGIQIHYEISGKKDAPVVVLSHSLASSLLMWNAQMGSLEPHFQVLRYDIRGHGGSDSPKGAYTLEMLGDDVVGMLDALNIDKVHFVGLSMGGMIGQSLALNHARCLQSLVLCNAGAVIPEEAQPVWQERINTAREKGIKALLEPTMERWFTPSFLRENSGMLALIRKEFLGTPVEGYIGCVEAIRRLNHLGRLPEISIPTLIMVGEDDPGTPVAASEAMHKRITNSRLVVLPSCRHLSNVEQHEAFDANLVKFLRQF